MTFKNQNSNLNPKFLIKQGDILYKKKPLDPEKLTSLTESIEIFDKILSKRKWAASETTLTLADISLCQSFCQLDAFEFDFQRFQRVSSWYKATQHKLKPYGYEVRHPLIYNF